jgi:hypothetical protein
MTTTRRFGVLQATIGLAAVTTALIHIWLAFQFPGGVDPVFILNGLGYVGLTALLLLPLPHIDPYRNLIRWVLIGYTLVTVLAWVFVGVRSPLAYPAQPACQQRASLILSQKHVKICASEKQRAIIFV